MPKRLIYVPLEPYRSRYTEYTAVAGGVYETIFRQEDVEFISVRPDVGDKVLQIKRGRVVDYLNRADYGFVQVYALLSRLADGAIDAKTDAVFFDDFWTPGFEMWPYGQSLTLGPSFSQHVPTYSFCYAQSTDPYDFTAPMHWWMRPMELGWTNTQRAVMCASKEMCDQWAAGGLPVKKLRWCGLPYYGSRILDIFGIPAVDPASSRKVQVVYSSRFDAEKNPRFLFDLAKRLKHVQFIVCTGLSASRFIETADVELLRAPSNIEFRTGLTKQQYFAILQESKVQFNCASQDFVSFTLLDATLNGCAPLYPNLLTFPDALNQQAAHLYIGDPGAGPDTAAYRAAIEDAAAKVDALLASDPADYSWVYRKYDLAVTRMLRAMGFDTKRVPFSMDVLCAETDLDVVRGMLEKEEQF